MPVAEIAAGYAAGAVLTVVGPVSTEILGGAVVVTVSAGPLAVAGGEAAVVGGAAAGGIGLAGGLVIAGAVVAVATPLIVGFVPGFASPNVRLYPGRMNEAIDPMKKPGQTKYILIAEQLTDNCYVYCFENKYDMDKAKHKFTSSRIMWELSRGQFCEIERRGFEMPFNTIRYAFAKFVAQAYKFRDS